MKRPQLVRVTSGYVPRVVGSEVVCGKCGTGWLFAAKNRRAYLNENGWTNTSKRGWLCPKCEP